MDSLKWQVSIQYNHFSFCVDLFMWRRFLNGRVQVMSEDSKGQKILVEFDSLTPLENIKPTLRLVGSEAGDILKALADAIDQQGVKIDSDAKVEGLLQATREHLSDMRRLVFDGIDRKPKSSGDPNNGPAQ